MDPRSSAHLQLALSKRKDGEEVALEFADKDLRGNRFVRADLCGGNFSGARLEKVNFSGAICFGARFNRAQLQGAILNGADLTGAKLSGADLSHAKLEGTCLAQTDCTCANIGQTTGMPSSVAGMRIDSATVKRSQLTDEQVIELYRQGATLVDLDNFTVAVQKHCSPLDDLPQSIPVRRQVSLDELDGHYAKISRSIPPSRARSLPPSVSQMLASDTGTQPTNENPHSIPRSYVLAETGDELLGVRLGARLAVLGPVQRFEATNRDGVRCVIVLYDPSADPSGSAFAAFRRGVRNLGRISELGRTTTVRIPDLLTVSIDELAYVARDLWNGNLTDIGILGWNPERMLQFFREVCRQVAALHELGIVHRCLCPSTILIGDDLKPVLMDIDAIDLVELARRGTSVLHAYAAPEELKGLSAYSPTADVFSLGKILYFLITGTVPPEGPIAHTPLAYPPGVAHGIRRIICKAIQAHPANRYPQVSSLLEELAHYSDAERVGCDGPLPEEADAESKISVPPSPKPNAVAAPQYPAFAVSLAPRAPLSERFMRNWGPRLGALGLGGSVACLFVGVFAPKVTYEGARYLALALGLCLGLSVLWCPLPLKMTPRARIMLAVFVALFLAVSDLRQLMTLRWYLNLKRGSYEVRATAVKNLIRSGKRDLSGAKLAGVNLSHTDLSLVSLRGADLTRANLRRALLSESDFTDSKILEADLRGSHLELSNVFIAVGWSSIHCDSRTSMPSGWSCRDGHPRQPETE